jgi:hypothetical protein
MSLKYALLFGSLIFVFTASGQKLILAKDAYKNVGKRVIVIGKINSFAEPGYSSSIYFTIITGSNKLGLHVEVPLKVWSKYNKRNQLISSKLKGKTLKVFGLIRIANEPYMIIEKASAINLSTL